MHTQTAEKHEGQGWSQWIDLHMTAQEISLKAVRQIGAKSRDSPINSGFRRSTREELEGERSGSV